MLEFDNQYLEDENSLQWIDSSLIKNRNPDKMGLIDLSIDYPANRFNKHFREDRRGFLDSE